MVIGDECIQEQNEEGIESGRASGANPCLSGLAGVLNYEQEQAGILTSRSKMVGQSNTGTEKVVSSDLNKE